MEHNPKKSKAFIITFILILLLLIGGYYLFKNRTQIFGTKGVSSISKIFSPLLGSSKNKGVTVIDENPNKKIVGITTVDVNGNKVVQSEAGENLKKGDVVYISGFNANGKPIVMKALASDKNKSLVFGVAGEDIAKGNLGNIIIDGKITGMATNKKEGTSWAPGNPLYLSDKIPGAMTKNAPVNPSFAVPVGIVYKIDPVSGEIYVGNLAKLITTDANGNKIVQSEAGENLKKGDVVYISGFNDAGKPIVMKAIANDINKSNVFGVAGETIIKGSTGNIVIDGDLVGIATNRKEGTPWAVGNLLYLSDKIAGEMTKNAPKLPSFVVTIGNITKVDPINGIIDLGALTNSNTWKSVFGMDLYNQVVNGMGDFGKILNTQLLKDFGIDIGEYWSSIFGGDSYKGTVFGGNSSGFNFSGFNTGGFTFNPIVPPGNVCTNGATDYPTCKNTTDPNGKCWNGATNPPTCNNGGNTGTCWNGATNYPTCDNGGNNQVCWNGATNYPVCDNGGGTKTCWNGATDYPTCKKTVGPDGKCYNGATNPLTCSLNVQDKKCTNGATNYPTCTTGADGKCVDPTKIDPPTCKTTKPGICANGAKNYPTCTTGADGKCLDTTKTNPPACDTGTTTNKCLLIEQNPLEFTSEQKAELDRQLRKFYLVSSSLKTPEDVVTTYNEIEQQQNLINQTKALTTQCYSEIDPKMGTYGWVRHGNPWYTQTSGGSFPYTNSSTGYSDGSWSTDINIPASERILNIW